MIEFFQHIKIMLHFDLGQRGHSVRPLDLLHITQHQQVLCLANWSSPVKVDQHPTPFLHQENLIFTFLTFSLLFVLFCRKVQKAIPCTFQSACQAHHASRLFAQAN